jgi:hypothetical protein
MTIVFNRVAAVLSVATFLVGLALPPLHVHLGEGADDHDQADGTVHAHWAAHHEPAGQLDIADGHGRVLFAASPVTRIFGSSSVALVVGAPALQSSIPHQSLTTTAEATRDGPPRQRSSLRAPPLVV